MTTPTLTALDAVDELDHCCDALECVMVLLSDRAGNCTLQDDQLYYLLECVDRRLRETQRLMAG